MKVIFDANWPGLNQSLFQLDHPVHRKVQLGLSHYRPSRMPCKKIDNDEL